MDRIYSLDFVAGPICNSVVEHGKAGIESALKQCGVVVVSITPKRASASCG